MFAAGSATRRCRAHFAPLMLVIDLARRAVLSVLGQQPRAPACVLWIGRRCWPNPQVLASGGGAGGEGVGLLARSVFVDPLTHDERVWAIDVALRAGVGRGDGVAGAVAAVIADGARLTMAESRRLQLAAGGGGGGGGAGGAGVERMEVGGVLGVLIRPSWEQRELSAAKTRWRVSPIRSDTAEPRWTVELLRCKGERPSEGARRWVVRCDHETGDVRLVVGAADRADPAAGSAGGPSARSA